jgi:hypothetical protein
VGGVGFAAGEPPLQRVGNPPVKVGRHPTLRDGAQADALICKQTDSNQALCVCNFFRICMDPPISFCNLCAGASIRNFSFQFPRKIFFSEADYLGSGLKTVYSVQKQIRQSDTVLWICIWFLVRTFST